MHKIFVLASVIAVSGAAAWMQGCSSDDSSGGNGTGVDAGKDGSSGGSSGGGSGSTSGGSSGGGSGSTSGGSSSGGSSGATDAGDDSNGGMDSATDGPSTSDAPSDDSSTGDAQTDDSSTPTDGGSDASDASDAGDAGDAGSCITLTVKDAPVGTPWCNVSVNGGAASTGAVQTVCVPAGTDVTLTATAQSGFELGATPWHGTKGDHGSGDPGTLSDAGGAAESTTSVVVNPANTCVWVCCPGVGGVPACPTTNQCP
jgi:hypothetical protein